jgi:ferritin-like metal-binding protein YciE
MEESMAAVQTMEDLFLEGLKEIYYVEQQIVEALPKMAKAVDSKDLREAFEHHLEETRQQVKRLEQAFKSCDEKPETAKCPAIDALIKEGEHIIKNTKDADVLAAGLLAGAQSVEHYEISRYGTLCAWAKELGYDDIMELLEETLTEEKNADQKLTQIAERNANKRAAA